jgi:hypothetical protein
MSRKEGQPAISVAIANLRKSPENVDSLALSFHRSNQTNFLYNLLSLSLKKKRAMPNKTDCFPTTRRLNPEYGILQILPCWNRVHKIK